MNVRVPPGNVPGLSEPGQLDPRPEGLLWRIQVSALIFIAASVSPGLILATGFLYSGSWGLVITAAPATLLYVFLVLNDHAVVKESRSGRSVWLSLSIRAMIPIAATTIAFIPILLRIFSGDINYQRAEAVSRITAPVLAEATREVDATIEPDRQQLEAYEVEDAAEVRRRSAIIANAENQETDQRGRLEKANADLREQEFILRCEKDGSLCTNTDSGRPGVNGPVSHLAEHRRDDAQARADTASNALKEIVQRRDKALEPIDGRLLQLEGRAGNPGLIAKLQAILASRNALIDAAVQKNPDVVAAQSPLGPSERLEILVDIVLQQPILLVLFVAAKLMITAVELSGMARGVGLVRSSLQILDREGDWYVARIALKSRKWRARRDFANEVVREAGLSALLKKNALDLGRMQDVPAE